MTTFDRLNASKDEKGAAFWVLLDPDRLDKEDLVQTTMACVENGADALLFGGSFLISTNFERMIREVKRAAPEIPLVIFPGIPTRFQQRRTLFFFYL
jgi:heptaprenylglyceryl phosphate synthase